MSLLFIYLLVWSPWKSMCRAELSCSESYVKILVVFWLHVCCIESIIGYEVFVHGQRLESSPLEISHIPFYLVHVKEEFKTFVIANRCKLHVQARADLWNLHNDELKTHLKSDILILYVMDSQSKQNMENLIDHGEASVSCCLVLIEWGF